ncbi:MAG TPA: FkbM family methyltransferase [Aeromicrobium sp.]|nr:FkbM family methyltransferase [Aeromicrobium sp.]
MVIDVGAAGGSYGRQLRAHRYGGRIVSFEPLAPSFADLAAAAEGDPRWDVHQLALGEASSTADLHVASNRDSSSLLPMLGAHLKASPTTQMETTQVVRVERLDDVLGTLDGSRPFLKIDAQGYERQVLAGAPETLKACVGLQLELSLVPLYEGGMLIDEALTWAYDSGFILMSVEQGFTASDGRILQMDGVFFRGE